MPSLRFHWSMSAAGEKFRGAKARAAQSGIPPMETLVEFCKLAEDCGIETLLTAFGFHRPDPIVLATALGMLTEKIKFMVAVRSGIFSPTAFVQQVNTASTIINGRICLNVVAGHTPDEQRSYGDFLDHDARYERADEYLQICRSFWDGEPSVNFTGKHYKIENGKLTTPFLAPDRSRPEIFLGGNSPLAEGLAIKHADCLWRLPDTPERLAPRIRPIIESGTEVGLLVSILTRETREEALRDAHSMIEGLGASPKKTHAEFEKKSDSVAFKSTFKLAEQGDSNWLSPVLWTGAVPYLGAVAIALVGSAEEVAAAILEYKSIGISQFLFMGWPDGEEMTRFAQQVLPIIRQREPSDKDLQGSKSVVRGVSGAPST